MRELIGMIPFPGKVTALLGAIVAGVCSVLGGWTPAMTTLLTLSVLDVISGFLRAAIQQKLSSKESFQGGIRKVLVFVVIALGAQADALLRESGVSIADGELVRNAAVIFYCVSEGLSIVENVVGAGLPVPQAIKDALAQLSENKIEEEPEGEA
jgi:toxin secretion/phage lysis holin